MQHLETDIGSSGPYRGKKERIMSPHVLLMTGTTVSYNLGSLPKGAIPFKKSRLVALETHHLP